MSLKDSGREVKIHEGAKSGNGKAWMGGGGGWNCGLLVRFA
jgi:hypothetical protein